MGYLASLWRYRRLGLLVAGVGGLALGIDLAFVSGLEPLDGPLRIPWWVLAVPIFLSERYTIGIQYGGRSTPFSVAEVPLVVGLFFSTPLDLLIAVVAGFGAEIVRHGWRQPMRALVNLATFVLEASVMLVVFHAFVDRSDPIGPMGWAAAFLATLAGSLTVDSTIHLDGGVSLPSLLRQVALGLAVSTSLTGLALAAVVILWSEPRAAWTMVVPTAALVLGYRAYAGERRKHESLEFLSDATRSLRRSRRMAPTRDMLLKTARDAFRAARAEMVLFPSQPDQPAERAALGPDGRVHVEQDASETADRGAARLEKGPPGDASRVAARGTHRSMSAPLSTQGVMIGRMRLVGAANEIAGFDQQDLRLFETFANHAGMGLENARLFERLESALEQQTDLNRVKDEFVATVSHELRTPLTSIQGFVRTLLRPDVKWEPEVQRELLERVDRQNERLRLLIEDLLTVSRIESQGIRPALGPVSVPDLARQLAEELNARAPDRRFVVDLDGVDTLDSDEALLHRILTNLVENAVKYGAAESPISLTARPHGRSVSISVGNQGAPIPAELRERIFERFFRAERPGTPSSGTGLGLYICRRLAEALGGSILLERSDAARTVFTLVIPASVASAGPAGELMDPDAGPRTGSSPREPRGAACAADRFPPTARGPLRSRSTRRRGTHGPRPAAGRRTGRRAWRRSIRRVPRREPIRRREGPRRPALL